MKDIIQQPNGTMSGYIPKRNYFDEGIYYSNYFNSPPADSFQLNGKTYNKSIKK